VAGIPYGIIEAAAAYLALASMKSTIISTISQRLPSNMTLTASQVYGIALLVAPVVTVVAGLIAGLILGAIYGWLYDRIPGGRAVLKGLIFGIIFWLIVSVLGGLANLEEGIGYYITSVGTGLLTALLFGGLLGYLYCRFSKPKELLVGPA